MSISTMRRWLALFLVLGGLAGCRSERVAFRFAPTSGRPESVLTNALPTDDDTAVDACIFSSKVAGILAITPEKYPRRPSLNNRPVRRHVLKRFQIVRCPALTRSSTSPSRTKPSAGTSLGGFLLLGGFALCVVAIILGTNLGGFSGLLVGTILFFAGSLALAFGYGGPDKPDPSKPKSETGVRPYLTLLFGLLTTVLLVGGGLGLLFHGGTSYLAATLTGAAMFLSAALYKLLKKHSTSNPH